MAYIDVLATETLCDIFRMLKDPVSRDWDEDVGRGRYDALRAAALVCRRWRPPAQLALCEELDISSRTHPRRAKRLLGSATAAGFSTQSLRVDRVDPVVWLQLANARNGLKTLIIIDPYTAPISRWGSNVLTRPCFARES